MNAVFDYQAFHALIGRFAAEVPGILAAHHTCTDLAAKVERLLTVAETPFTIAVVGQMRAGKSSLLNALVGADLAVTGVNETTATINWFKYGSKEQSERFRVNWKDRPAEEFPLPEIRHWIGDSERAKATRFLEFFSPVAFLRQANIVDTPGTRSVLADHTQTLHDFLALKQDRETRREGESADAIVYVLMPVARQTDADLLTDFERTTRMPGTSPFNSLAIVHKWETLASDDAHAEAQRKCERISSTLGNLVSLVLPVSAPLAMAAERYDVSLWHKLLDLTNNTPTDVLDDLLLSDQEFKTWNETACPLSPAARHKLLEETRLPWPSFKVLLRVARKEQPASPDALRRAIYQASGIGPFRDALQNRFLTRSRMIKAFSILSKALEPCQIASSRLRNHKNRFSRLLDEAERSSGALSEIMAAGAGQLESVHRYVEETRRIVQQDLRSVGEALHRLGEIVVAIKDAYDDMDTDLQMLEQVEKVRHELGEEWAAKLRGLFGSQGPTLADRLGQLTSADVREVALADIEEAIGCLRKMQTSARTDLRKTCAHALRRLEQIADFLEQEQPLVRAEISGG